MRALATGSSTVSMIGWIVSRAWAWLPAVYWQ